MVFWVLWSSNNFKYMDVNSSYIYGRKCNIDSSRRRFKICVYNRILLWFFVSNWFRDNFGISVFYVKK